MKPIEPEAYRIGWVPFIHTKIWLDSRPLIPRPETEYWVNEVVSILKSQILNPKSIRILDLCAGSGCIGIAFAKDIPNAQVDFVEFDEQHHETIRKNCEENGISPERFRIFGGSLFENISDKYDLILSNPPYIDMSLGRVEESVLEYEPKLALDGGKGGTEILARILQAAPAHLRHGAYMYLEHEPEQVEYFAKHVKHPVSDIDYLGSFKDQYGVERWSQFGLRS